MRGWCFLVSGLVPLACATLPSVDAALKSDLGTLRRSIAAEQKDGAIDRTKASKIAQAVAAREVYSGTGPGAAARIRGLRACALPVMDALEARASRQDEAGAEATLVLLAARRVPAEPLASRYDDADSGAWRAVAARASLSPSRFHKRRQYFVDPDQRVRRAAFEAALEAPASLDLPALVEAARLDPDAQSRSLATRAIGNGGGEAALRALVDLWEHAGDDDRVTIVEALGRRRTLEAGGRAELLHIAEGGHGVAAVAAAGTLLRVDPSSASAAGALLARAVTSGSGDEQLLAIQLAPLDGPARKALDDTSKGADPELRIAALERLLAVPSERARVLAALRAEAKSPDDVADAAKAALARAGDASVGPYLVRSLASHAWRERQDAGLALVTLGDYGHASTLLADDDANVRVSIACRILGS
ncbi:MAG TPA: hypothetical protein VGQ57_15260 [Polyangiaceae bacterium]|nr:hypothetical protein [Polyangiaceae bacterium]